MRGHGAGIRRNRQPTRQAAGADGELGEAPVPRAAGGVDDCAVPGASTGAWANAEPDARTWPHRRAPPIPSGQAQPDPHADCVCIASASAAARNGMSEALGGT